MVGCRVKFRVRVRVRARARVRVKVRVRVRVKVRVSPYSTRQHICGHVADEPILPCFGSARSLWLFVDKVRNVAVQYNGSN